MTCLSASGCDSSGHLGACVGSCSHQRACIRWGTPCGLAARVLMKRVPRQVHYSVSTKVIYLRCSYLFTVRRKQDCQCVDYNLDASYAKPVLTYIIPFLFSTNERYSHTCCRWNHDDAVGRQAPWTNHGQTTTILRAGLLLFMVGRLNTWIDLDT